MNVINIILIFGIIVATAFHRIVSKSYTLRIKNGAFTFSFLNIGSAILIYLLSGGFHFGFPPSLYLYALAFSLFYFAAALCYLLAINIGSLAVTSLIISYATIVPALFGLIFLNEPASPFLLAGLIFLAVSLLLINSTQKSNQKNISFKWILFVGLAFIGNSGTGILQKVQGITYNGLYKNEFLVMAFFLAALASFVTALLKEKKQIVFNLKTGGLFGLMCGLLSGIINLFVCILSDPARSMPASVMFPLISSGGIICSVLVAHYIFKEKLTKRQLLGFCFGVVSVVLLSI